MAHLTSSFIPSEGHLPLSKMVIPGEGGGEELLEMTDALRVLSVVLLHVDEIKFFEIKTMLFRY